MNEPQWLSLDVVHAIHNALLGKHGGAAGIRDEDLLASAIARPRNLLASGEPDLFEMATAYTFGIVRNHPLVDGNKRTGLMAAYTFLEVNGFQLEAPEPEAVAVIQDVAAGELGEAELAVWIRTNVKPLV